ncbi:MAG: 5'/3'-nucleotidase SurE [Andreesenia angusta]|nr:5'/3'-nucleotidase SurE [Andreesenia angusta]
MNILVTNDDGINSEGIKILANLMKPFGNVYVVAPDSEKSAVGHGITTHRPLRIKKMDNYLSGVKLAYQVSGTPADCVKMGIEHILDIHPDLLVSGINFGQNLGTDVLYSGTVSAAIEGSINDISLCMAFSLTGRAKMNYDAAKAYIPKIISTAIADSFRGTILNVNIPSVNRENINGVAYTELGVQKYSNAFIEREDPHGGKYYWMSGVPEKMDNNERSDIAAIEDNVISVTPLQYDMTNYFLLKQKKDFNL